MAINAAMNWWVRPGGAETNGGGYDSTVAGAGTNYADQDAAQVVFSSGNANRLNCVTGAAVVTSDGTPFTSQMVGNVIRISGGTHWTTGYYVVVTFTSTSQVTLDRDPTDGSNATLGVGSLGGAHALINSYANNGGGTQPILGSPLAAGHTVNVRGGGTNDPAAADYTALDYLQFPSGDTTSGYITWLGYNGRPCLSSVNGLIFYQVTGHRFSHMKMITAGGSLTSFGIIKGSGACHIDDVYVDASGIDTAGVFVTIATNCRFSNSGSTSAGTSGNAAITMNAFNVLVMGNRIKDWRAEAIVTLANMATVRDNVITGCKLGGVVVTSNTGYGNNIIANTIDSCGGDGILVNDAESVASTTIFNNILTRNTGYGINCSTGSTALNDRMVGGRFDYNNFGTGGTANTSGARHNHSAGAHDVALDPQFTNTAADDYSVGTNMKAIGFPGSFPT